MKLSSFGKKLTANSGILELMDDLGKAMAGNDNMLMLGGGNPAHIPQVQKIFRERMSHILKNEREFEKMVGNYTTPQGDAEFIEATATLFKNKFGFNITTKNICVLPGSQTTFFFLFNMIAGKFDDGSEKKILLPIVPEYIGYVDQGIHDGLFQGIKPIIEIQDKHTFKYHIDFKNLKITKDTAAICISRPTNPTGNVISDESLEKLHKLAKKHSIPLIVDNAYGAPFPNILFTKVMPFWDENVIYVLTLSKLGLPSVRTSIVIAKEEVITALSSINAIVSLSTGTLGQRITLPLMKSGEIIDMSKNIIQPFYEKKSRHAIEYFKEKLNDSLPVYLHKSEGALFLWMWCKDLPITAYELYNRLKKKGVLIVPGNYFFPGFPQKWRHKDECIRITYIQDKKTVEKGLSIIAEELNRLYK